MKKLCEFKNCKTSMSIGSPDFCPKHNHLNKVNLQIIIRAARILERKNILKELLDKKKNGEIIGFFILKDSKLRGRHPKKKPRINPYNK